MESLTLANNLMKLAGRGHRVVWRLALPMGFTDTHAISPRPCRRCGALGGDPY